MKTWNIHFQGAVAFFPLHLFFFPSVLCFLKVGWFHAEYYYIYIYILLNLHFSRVIILLLLFFKIKLYVIYFFHTFFLLHYICMGYFFWTKINNCYYYIKWHSFWLYWNLFFIKLQLLLISWWLKLLETQELLCIF